MSTFDKDLVVYVTRTVTAAARKYLEREGVDLLALVNDEASVSLLHELIKEESKKAIETGLRDAKEALDAGMPQVAEQTFQAELVVRGIFAAKRFLKQREDES